MFQVLHNDGADDITTHQKRNTQPRFGRGAYQLGSHLTRSSLGVFNKHQRLAGADQDRGKSLTKRECWHAAYFFIIIQVRYFNLIRHIVIGGNGKIDRPHHVIHLTVDNAVKCVQVCFNRYRLADGVQGLQSRQAFFQALRGMDLLKGRGGQLGQAGIRLELG